MEKTYRFKSLLISSLWISMGIITVRICLLILYSIFSLKFLKMTYEKLINEYAIGSLVIFMKAFCICLIISLFILLIQAIRQKTLNRK